MRKRLLFARDANLRRVLVICKCIFPRYTHCMNRKKTTDWSGCPIRYGMGIFGDKWSLLIIRDLMFKGKRHFGEFTDPEEAIATNILADRLKRLEAEGIISKTRDAEHGARFVYGLTPKGAELLPVMLSIIDWAEKYDAQTEVPKEFIRDFRRDRAAFQEKLMSQLVD